ncbi:Rap1a/Tai family immunity protein [Roseomonas chloroacetimidivorans]|uniref:Rap1a/Tai family immunity protein n=1 Tax=Roseomonas chloroacetimidivorans TaxID=1766656 RepID=UPI003C761F4E
MLSHAGLTPSHPKASTRSIHAPRRSGIADALMAGSVILGEWACIPDEVTVGQVRAGIRRHPENNPQSRHVTAARITAIALSQAFPCRRPQVALGWSVERLGGARGVISA